MNVILNPSQSNTRTGARTLLAYVDLTGKENQLLKVVNDGGVAKYALPTAITDMAMMICASGSVAGAETAAETPSSTDTCRVLVTNAVNPGDLLSLDPNNYGKLYKPGVGSGATTAWFVAEEAAAANGLCLMRKIGPMAFTP